MEFISADVYVNYMYLRILNDNNTGTGMYIKVKS